MPANELKVSGWMQFNKQRVFFVDAEAKVRDFRNDVVEKENVLSSYIAMDEAFGRDVFHA